MSTKLFVGNLSFNTTENDLNDAFAAHGTVVETNLMVDRATGRPRGFGFVTMSTPEAAANSTGAPQRSMKPGRAKSVRQVAAVVANSAAAAAGDAIATNHCGF